MYLLFMHYGSTSLSMCRTCVTKYRTSSLGNNQTPFSFWTSPILTEICDLSVVDIFLQLFFFGSSPDISKCLSNLECLRIVNQSNEIENNLAFRVFSTSFLISHHSQKPIPLCPVATHCAPPYQSYACMRRREAKCQPGPSEMGLRAGFVEWNFAWSRASIPDLVIFVFNVAADPRSFTAQCLSRMRETQPILIPSFYGGTHFPVPELRCFPVPDDGARFVTRSHWRGGCPLPDQFSVYRDCAGGEQ